MLDRLVPIRFLAVSCFPLAVVLVVFQLLLRVMVFRVVVPEITRVPAFQLQRQSEITGAPALIRETVGKTLAVVAVVKARPVETLQHLLVGLVVQV
jgi:hypothetical protein